MNDLVQRLNKLASAPTIAPTSVYANICGEAAIEVGRLKAAAEATRVAALRALMKLSHEEYTAMLLAASKIPLERENGGLEYPPFKVFNAMLFAYAKTNGINL